MKALSITARAETWPIAGTFAIARGSKTTADVVVATASDGTFAGRGECVPYARYGETTRSVIQAIAGIAARINALPEPPADGIDGPERSARLALLQALPAGAARNAIDCALWDLECKRRGAPVWELAGMPRPKPVVSAFTISLANAQEMGDSAAHAGAALLKVKLGGTAQEDIERLQAVRRAAPTARLIVDANEGWRMQTLRKVAPAAAELGVELLEQPLPAADDHPLATWQAPVPLGADESAHGDFGVAARTLADRVAAEDSAVAMAKGDAQLQSLAARYAVFNVKLDKAGGLTSAIALTQAARAHGFAIMAGCMVATSLSMAPALLLAQDAHFVDLDGPLLLARDRPDGLRYAGQSVAFPPAGGWGQP